MVAEMLRRVQRKKWKENQPRSLQNEPSTLKGSENEANDFWKHPGQAEDATKAANATVVAAATYGY